MRLAHVSISFKVILGVLAALGMCLGSDREKARPFTVVDSVEFAQPIRDFGAPAVLVSPDKTRYVVFVHRGDIKRNGSWISVLSGRLTSIESAKPVEIAKLFSHSTAEVQDLVKNMRWEDDSRNVSFLWDSGTLP